MAETVGELRQRYEQLSPEVRAEVDIGVDLDGEHGAIVSGSEDGVDAADRLVDAPPLPPPQFTTLTGSTAPSLLPPPRDATK